MSSKRLAAVGATALLCALAACGGPATRSGNQSQPWTAADTVTPADLVHELAQSGETQRPEIVYTGPALLYRQGHIPGASMHGPASTAQGLSDLTAWARGLQPTTELVVYCGCCPLSDCPNLRPSFEALRGMGFRRLRVLLLPNNFATDWIEKGYPVEK